MRKVKVGMKKCGLIILTAVLVSVLVFINLKYPSPQTPFIIGGCAILIVFALAIFIFESRQKTAKMLAVTSVFIVLSTLGNFLSVSMVPFEMGTAFIIITGMLLGPQAGFMTGLISRFIINIFYMQGIWTVWQMLGWGILGVLSGFYFFNKDINADEEKGGVLKAYRLNGSDKTALFASLIFIVAELVLTATLKNLFIVYCLGALFVLAGAFILNFGFSALKLTLFGFFATFFIYGGLLNFSTVVAVGSSITIQTVTVVYASGAVYDLLHATGCALFLLVFAPTVFQIFKRLNLKYKILE